MTNVWDERHAPLSDVELGEVWSDFGYAQMTPRRFKDLAAAMVAAVLAAQERTEREQWAARQANWDEQRGVEVYVDTSNSPLIVGGNWKRTASSAREPVDPEVPF